MTNNLEGITTYQYQLGRCYIGVLAGIDYKGAFTDMYHRIMFGFRVFDDKLMFYRL